MMADRGPNSFRDGVLAAAAMAEKLVEAYRDKNRMAECQALAGFADKLYELAEMNRTNK